MIKLSFDCLATDCYIKTHTSKHVNQQKRIFLKVKMSENLRTSKSIDLLATQKSVSMDLNSDEVLLYPVAWSDKKPTAKHNLHLQWVQKFLPGLVE